MMMIHKIPVMMMTPHDNSEDDFDPMELDDDTNEVLLDNLMASTAQAGKSRGVDPTTTTTTSTSNTFCCCCHLLTLVDVDVGVVAAPAAAVVAGGWSVSFVIGVIAIWIIVICCCCCCHHCG